MIGRLLLLAFLLAGAESRLPFLTNFTNIGRADNTWLVWFDRSAEHSHLDAIKSVMQEVGLAIHDDHRSEDIGHLFRIAPHENNWLGEALSHELEVVDAMFMSLITRFESLLPKALLALIHTIEPNLRVKALDVQNNPGWHLDRIDQAEQQLDTRYGFTQTGKGVNIFIMDSGIRTDHQEFEGPNGTSRAHFLYNYWGDDDTGDCNGHGTHCAGLAIGKTAGVARDAEAYSVKVLDCEGEGSTNTLYAGLVHIHNYGKNRQFLDRTIISLSLGGDRSEILDWTIGNITDEFGILIVAAAGNDDQDACQFSPSDNDRVITVGATAKDDRRAIFSNHGPCVNIWAPGEYIRSASNVSPHDYQYLSGTSMATPIVAGLAALYMENNTLLEGPAVGRLMLNDSQGGVVYNQGIGSPQNMAFSIFNEGYHYTEPSIVEQFMSNYLGVAVVFLFISIGCACGVRYASKQQTRNLEETLINPNLRRQLSSDAPIPEGFWDPVVSSDSQFWEPVNPATAHGGHVVAASPIAGVNDPRRNGKGGAAAARRAARPKRAQPSYVPPTMLGGANGAGWKCEKCTFKNQPSHLTCGMCGAIFGDPLIQTQTAPQGTDKDQQDKA